MKYILSTDSLDKAVNSVTLAVLEKMNEAIEATIPRNSITNGVNSVIALTEEVKEIKVQIEKLLSPDATFEDIKQSFIGAPIAEETYHTISSILFTLCRNNTMTDWLTQGIAYTLQDNDAKIEEIIIETNDNETIIDFTKLFGSDEFKDVERSIVAGLMLIAGVDTQVPVNFTSDISAYVMPFNDTASFLLLDSEPFTSNEKYEATVVKTDILRGVMVLVNSILGYNNYFESIVDNGQHIDKFGKEIPVFSVELFYQEFLGGITEDIFKIDNDQLAELLSPDVYLKLQSQEAKFNIL